MATVFFVLLAFMLAAYAVLDGWDLGVGALHRLLARTDAEREEAAAAIGPTWNGNEVWLIAAGGVLFLAFPRAYAAAFSGLYLGLIILLWLLVGRGLGLELRHQVDDPLWRVACDTVFWVASAGLALLLGVALGNVVRGVPLRPDGYFHLPLFNILNWYALLVGLTALVVLAAHGATFLAARANGVLAQRAARWARRMWWAELVVVAGLAGPTYAVRETMITSFGDHPWRLVFPLLAVAAFATQFALQRSGAWLRALGASSVFIAALLATTAAGLYPNILPAREGRPFGLTAQAAATDDHALAIAIVWWSIGIALAIAYFVVVYRVVFGRGRRA